MFNISTSTYYYSSDVTLDILIKNHPIQQFDHKDKVYVEGREGSDYSIRVKNKNSGDILAIISVDGLSIVDGKPASEKSRGWIVKANSEINIPGWLVDSKAAAKFQFSGKKNSYAEKSEDGDIKNVGVIGCLIFTKKDDIRYRSGFLDNFFDIVWPTIPPTTWPDKPWGGQQIKYGYGNDESFMFKYPVISE